MDNFYQGEVNRLLDYRWELRYNRKTHKAILVNEYGRAMDLTTFSYCLDALENTRYDLNELRYGESTKEPLDDFTKKQLGLQDYQLLRHKKEGENTKEVFEVYSDDLDIFTLDHYTIYEGRKRYDCGFLAYLNRFDAEKVLESLRAFVERGKSMEGDER